MFHESSKALARRAGAVLTNKHVSSVITVFQALLWCLLLQ